MRTSIRKMLAAVCVALALTVAVVGAAVVAQTSATFDLTWNVMGNGGGESASAGYRLNGTVGQGLASPPASSSAGFRLESGFWPGGSGPDEGAVYLPSLSR